ncbi:leucine-rich repeat domain-containing protein, partial [Candidatus Albibeggiatoa sp. nov. BB20]|uniref:leucine-rich repeat domain-containing protein n=1 Tax=Candidatus Albibeggiatoa sp. nov. BB20 TaxID=3162723 RepID=UPI00336545B0
MTIRRPWYIYGILLYLCCSSVLPAATIDCTQNRCDYSLQLEQAGTYQLSTTLPDDGTAGILGLSLSSDSQSFNNFTTRSIADLSQSTVHWTSFILPEPQSISFIPHNYLDETQSILAALYRIVDGERIAFYEPTLMNSGQEHITPELEAGDYIAEVSSADGSTIQAGLEVIGNNIEFQTTGGWNRADTETFVLFDSYAELSTIQFSLLFGNNYPLGASQPVADIKHIDSNGEQQIIWNSLSELQALPDLDVIKLLEKVIDKSLTQTSINKVMGHRNAYALDANNHIVGLNLSRSDLSTVPQFIFAFEHLSKLSLSQNQISQFPARLTQLQNLTELNLSDNQISQIPETVNQLQNLDYLSIYENELTTLPAEIGQLVNLKGLYLGSNQLQTVPSEIGQLQKLTVLWLQNNQLKTLPPEMSNLNPELELWIWGNPLQQPSLEIANQGIEAIRNYFDSLLEELSDLEIIQRLEQELGKSLTELVTKNAQQQVIELDLSYLSLTQIPKQVSFLKHLQKLILNGNKLVELPPEIGQLLSLTWLDLRDNRLKSLPPEIGQLQSLTWLDLRDNRLKSLPPEIGQLQSLTELNLYNNPLQSLPPEIGQLQSLTTLYLGYSQFQIGSFSRSIGQLQSLPPEIGQLQSLTTLDLSRNKLQSLPPEIGQLQSLTSLNLSVNQLQSLPPEIGQLQSLT